MSNWKVRRTDDRWMRLSRLYLRDLDRDERIYVVELAPGEWRWAFKAGFSDPFESSTDAMRAAEQELELGWAPLE